MIVGRMGPLSLAREAFSWGERTHRATSSHATQTMLATCLKRTRMPCLFHKKTKKLNKGFLHNSLLLKKEHSRPSVAAKDRLRRPCTNNLYKARRLNAKAGTPMVPADDSFATAPVAILIRRRFLRNSVCHNCSQGSPTYNRAKRKWRVRSLYSCHARQFTSTMRRHAIKRTSPPMSQNTAGYHTVSPAWGGCSALALLKWQGHRNHPIIKLPPVKLFL